MQIDNYKFFHLIPDNGYGGVENAARNFNYYRNENFEFKVVFINNNPLKDKAKVFKRIKTLFLNNFKVILSLHKEKNVILISSLWKSCLLATFIKFLRKDIKLIRYCFICK